MKLPDSVAIADDIRVNGNASAASIPCDGYLARSPSELHGALALIIGYGAGLLCRQVVQLPPKPC